MTGPGHPTREELEAGLERVLRSPRDAGVVEMIVRRPAADERELLEEGELDVEVGLVGDGWRLRASSGTPDGSPHPEKQLTLMNARAADLVARERGRWPLAGDQLYVDLDLSTANLPPGTRLALGSALVEVTAPPHTGCAKFVARFGAEAMRFVNSPAGRELRLRGANARVVSSGVVRVGDVVRRVGPGAG